MCLSKFLRLMSLVEAIVVAYFYRLDVMDRLYISELYIIGRSQCGVYIARLASWIGAMFAVYISTSEIMVRSQCDYIHISLWLSIFLTLMPWSGAILAVYISRFDVIG